MPASRTSPRSPSERTRRNGQAGPARRVPALLRCSPGNGLPPAPLRLDEKDSCSFIESGHWLDCARQPASGQPAPRSPPASLAPASPDPHDASLPGGVRVLGTLGGSRGAACRRIVPAERTAWRDTPGHGSRKQAPRGRVRRTPWPAAPPQANGMQVGLPSRPYAGGTRRFKPLPSNHDMRPSRGTAGVRPFPSAGRSRFHVRPTGKDARRRGHAVAAIHVRAATRGNAAGKQLSRGASRPRTAGMAATSDPLAWRCTATPGTQAAGRRRATHRAGRHPCNIFVPCARPRERGHGPHGNGSSGATTAPATKDGRQAALAWRCASTSSTSATDSSRACISTVRW